MGGFIFGKSFHTFHNRTPKASPPIPSGRWCWLFCMLRLSCVWGLQSQLAAKLSLSVCPLPSKYLQHLQALVAFHYLNGKHLQCQGETGAADTQSTSY